MPLRLNSHKCVALKKQACIDRWNLLILKNSCWDSGEEERESDILPWTCSNDCLAQNSALVGLAFPLYNSPYSPVGLVAG